MISPPAAMDPPRDPPGSSSPSALELAVKWAGSHTFRIVLVAGGTPPVPPSSTDPTATLVLDLTAATVGDLKHLLASATRVPADAQKLLGLVRGKLPADDSKLAALDLKPGTTVRLMGTPVADRFVEPAPPPRKKKRGSEDEMHGGDEKRQVLAAPGDEEDNEGVADEVEEVVDLVRLPHIMTLLERYTRQTEINLINAPRPGKRLLVLDLDHTIFDCRARGVRNRSDLLRPGTHDMLTTLYAHYDLVIWSQTSWHALERKVTDMGLLTHPQYSISFVLDRTAMFEVTSPARDTPHQVKPLAIIWARFPGIYAPHNTVHIDDLSRNFALNPRNGIKVSPWHVAKGTKSPDNECAKVTRYLVHLAGNVEDVTAVDHRLPPAILEFTVETPATHPIHVVLVRAPAAAPQPDPNALFLHLPTATVGDLKDALARVMGASGTGLDLAGLAHDGQFPANSTKLVDLGLENGTTAHLVPAVSVVAARAVMDAEGTVEETDGAKAQAERHSATTAHLVKPVSVANVRAMMAEEGAVDGTGRAKVRADRNSVKSAADGVSTIQFGTAMCVADARALMDEEGSVENQTMRAHDDDHDIDHRDNEDAAIVPDLARVPRVLDLLERQIRMADIHILHAPRPGKRLLVVDLDHTLFDCRARGVRSRADLLRPGTHEMLTTLYPHYDLVVWSQTVRAALETKLAGIGLLTHPGYRIAFVLDRSAMIELALPDWDAPHPVKPLAVIWARFPGIYTARNTLHVDDMRRNFVLNPRNGIKVAPWYVGKAGKGAIKDTECAKVARYLVHVAGHVEDVTSMDHTRWRKAAV
ncbi:hypothetical protein GGF31_001248 [Allomyces arbusculus]|nr:hypothetical protein GGF31_001248 [Allomyces arbusculus]